MKFLKKYRVVFAILAAVCLTACGKSLDKQILGAWERAEGSTGFYELNFFDDGTFDVGFDVTSDWAIVNGDTLKLTWSVWSNRVGVDTYEISIHGDTMTLTGENGKVQTYQRAD